MKKVSICILIALCTTIFFWPAPVHAENKTSIIVATGKDVPTDDHLPEAYRFPAKYRGNAVQFVTEDGILLCGYVLGKGSKGITLGHPNGWMVKSWLPFAEQLVDEGYMVILWEFRGNKPSGSATGEAARRWDLDVLAAAQVLRERGATEILSMDASDGGTTTAVAARHIPDLIGLGILSSPKDSVGNALEAVGKINVPAFFAVSTHDFAENFYPEVKALYEACSSTQKQFNVIDGPDHGTDMITPDVPGVGYAALPKDDEQKQKRKELADKLMLFVNEAFGKSADDTFTSTTNEPTNEATITTSPKASLPDETAKAPVNTPANKKAAITTPWLIGAIIILIVLFLAMLKIMKKTKRSEH